ncbi:uncharacterized protein BJ212DRAFT_1480604 [Suillus subaureus]|uniref:Fungal-type protein kinase domain-containing protein n=1 Tax=Suillus subaureus TaxID=48587 RepID=A0A9P7EBB8_9AGAM|nr:uncharacterized protein BJ212DRAFT_1480604 [Suillus subaureus]KAG1816745.1 hypothetical protein BJ212DRAFT_1480604 [Suillus subaureus]
MASFFRTVDNGIKLSSLLSIPDVSDVHTMNKITSDELNCLVMHKDAPEASQLLGHLLSHIFKPFKVPLPHVSELQIPLKKIIHPNEHVRLQYHGLLPDSLVPLYNIETSTWNWDLPVNPPGGGSDSDASGGSSHGAPVSQDPEVADSATYEEIFASFMNALAGCLSASQPLLEHECYATRTWSAANAHKALPGSEIKCKPDLVLSDNITAKWGNIRVSGELIHSPYKPVMWLGKAADTHAYLMMSEQPWRRFALILSFTNAYHHLQVLLYDHSGGMVSTRFDIYQQPDLFSHIIAVINFADPATSTSESLDELGSWDPSSDDDLESVVSDDSGSEEHLTDSEDTPEGNSIESTMQTEEFPPSLPPVQSTMVSSAPLLSLASQIPQDLTESISSITPHPSQFPYSVHSPEPCGKICVGDDVYIINLGDEDFIIKDHWILGKREDVILNEIEMLKLMQGVPGVPELVDYWLVMTSEGEVDVTRSYHKRECWSTKGTSRTHVCLVLKPCARPLHMFQTLKEFVRALRDIVIICIAVDNKYSISGTGTVPFMSHMLLSQVSLLQQQVVADAEQKKLMKANKLKLKLKSKNAPALKTPKTSSDSLALPISHVVQGYSDDLESLFFIFTWVCIKFCSPNGMVRQERMPNSLLDRWTSLDLALCAVFKITFFANPLDEQHLINKFHPYFKPLIPLAKDWCAALKDNMVNPVTFDAILHILNSHLEELSNDEELQSTVTMLKKTATALNGLKHVASLSLPILKWRKSDDSLETSKQV